MRQWLTEARKEKGLSQADIARRVGIKPPTYCNIENGKRGLKPETAKKIAAVLGFDWTLFFEKEESA